MCRNFLIVLLFAVAFGQDCPDQCSCFGYPPEYIIDCAKRNFIQVPSNIPVSATELHLQFNDISSISSDAFSGLTSLKFLYLQSNKIEALPDNVFEDLISLTALRLNDNLIPSLGNNNFANLTKLQVLYAHNNKLTSVDETTFAGLENNLQHLSIAGNAELTTISVDSFASLSELKYCDISGSAIENVSPSMFNRNAKLLYFFVNDISTIICDENMIPFVEYENNNPPTPNNETDLEVLGSRSMICAQPAYLQGQTIATISIDVLYEHPCPDNCTCFGSVQNYVVDCSNRGLTAVPDNIPVNATELHLQFNEIENIGVNDFTALINLKHLLLHSNKMTELPNFENLENLESLRINDNQIRNLGITQFLSLSNLQILYAHNNALTSIRENTFAGLSKIQHLSIAGNPDLRSIDINAFSLLINLKYADISGCAITTLYPALFTRNPKLRYFFVYDITTISCDDEMKDFVDYMDNLTPTPNDDTDLEVVGTSSMVCAQPERLQGTTVDELSVAILEYCPTACSCFGFAPELIVDCSNRGLTLIPEDIPANATELHLQFNMIGRITARQFNGLKKLKYLYLQSNKIENLPENVFDELINLEALRINDNLISNLGSNTFSNLTKLTILYSHNNLLTDIDDNTFVGLENSLEHLSVAGNQYLSSIHIDTFSSLSKLKYLDISGSSITTIPTAMFLRNNALRFFYVYHINTMICDDNIEEFVQYLTENPITIPSFINKRNLEVIGASLMTCAQPEHLRGTPVSLLSTDNLVEAESCPDACACFSTIVDCSSRKLDALPTNMPFEATELFLQNNLLTEIPANKLLHMTNLQYIYLHNNMITDVTAAAFNGAAKTLKMLTLNNNLISSLDTSIFNDMTSLEVLNLNSNNLEGGFSNFGRMTDLVQLSLNGNNLNRISDSDLAALSKLRNFGAAHNPLRNLPDVSMNSNLVYLDLSSTQSEKIPSIPQSLEVFQFTNASVLSITKDSFANANNLNTINLQDNKIYVIEMGAFIGAPRLNTLLLQNNDLKEIDDEMFANLPTLADLHIEDNTNLKSISVNAFWSSRNSLQHLDMRNCGLETLDGQVLDTIKNKYFSADIEGNPFNCDCQLESLVNYMIEEKRVNGEPVCASPEEFAGKQIDSVPYTDLCHQVITERPTSKDENLALIISLTIVCAVALVFGILAYIFWSANQKFSKSKNSVEDSSSSSSDFNMTEKKAEKEKNAYSNSVMETENGEVGVRL